MLGYYCEDDKLRTVTIPNQYVIHRIAFNIATLRFIFFSLFTYVLLFIAMFIWHPLENNMLLRLPSWRGTVSANEGRSNATSTNRTNRRRLKRGKHEL